jgi:hypothetical protein
MARRELALGASQLGASVPTVTRPSVGAMYSPRSLAVSTVAANAAASRLVVNPRFQVCLFSGLR